MKIVYIVCHLTVSSGLCQVVVCPERPDRLDHSHHKLHITVNLLAVPAELQQNQKGNVAEKWTSETNNDLFLVFPLLTSSVSG